MPSHRGDAPQQSPNQARLAQVDRDQRLHVIDRRGKRLVATGSYNDCEGSTMRIAGWLDSRYLVYAISNESYIYDAELGRSKKLFKVGDVVSAYFW
jgi:hypothetical protein